MPNPPRPAKFQPVPATNQAGWGLLETLLTLGAVTALSAGIYLALRPASATAQVKAEQDNLHQLSQAVDRSFGTMGSFKDVSASKVLSSGLAPDKMAQAGTLRTQWGSQVSIHPGTVASPGDSFVITYPGTPAQVCARLAAAVAGQAHDIRINGQSVYAANGLDTNRAASRCAQAPAVMEFVYHSGLVAGQSVAATPLDLPPGVPAVAPPPGPPGHNTIGQAPGVGPAGGVTPVVLPPPGTVTAPPLPGAPPPAPVPQPAPVLPPDPPSVPPTVDPCAPPPGWVETGARVLHCPAGQYGNIEQQRQGVHAYSCPEAWGDPVDSFDTTGWGTWTTAANNCAACPPPLEQAQTQWVSDSAACPPGQAGAHAWEKEQDRTRTRSYDCPAGTLTLPDPDYTAWSAWADTGAIRNETNTCAPVVDGTCPAREFVIGCVVYGYSGTPTGAYAEIYSVDGSGGVDFDNGDSVRCVIGYADTLQANHLPLVPSDANLYRLHIVNADPINDWDSIYSRAEDNSSYVEVFAKKADGTNGDRCYGQAKVMFNYEDK